MPGGEVLFSPNRRPLKAGTTPNEGARRRRKIGSRKKKEKNCLNFVSKSSIKNQESRRKKIRKEEKNNQESRITYATVQIEFQEKSKSNSRKQDRKRELHSSQAIMSPPRPSCLLPGHHVSSQRHFWTSTTPKISDLYISSIKS